MRRLVFLMLPVALATAAAQNAPTTKAQSTSAAKQQLIRNEEGWAAALVKRDAEYFKRMLAPKFVYTEDAKLMSREDVLRSPAATASPTRG